jgi:AsmA protein
MSGNDKKGHRILKVAALCVVLLIIILITLPFLIDINQFKPQLESKLSDALGRSVKLGNLKLSLLSGSVMVEEIAIADNPAFSKSPFLSAKSVKAAVELKPLIFSKSIRIDGITLDKPDITLISSSSGSWNFSDLGRKKTIEKTVETGKKSGEFSEKDVSIKHLKIIGGQITIIQDGKKKPSIYKDVNITATNLSFTTDFPFTLTATLPGQGALKLQGNAGPLNNTDMMKTPMAAEIVVENFDLIASGFIPPGSGLAGLINFSGNIESDGNQIRSKGRAAADKLQIVKSGSPAGNKVILGYAADYDLAHRKGNLNDVKIEYGNAVAHLDGNYDMSGKDFVLKMKLHGTNMPVQDLTTLLPAFGVILPKGATLQGGSLTVNMAAEGQVEKMITAGSVEILQTKLIGFDLAGKLSSVATLAGLKSSKEVAIEKLSSDIRLTPEGTQMSNLLLIMPELGEMSGNGKMANDQTLDFTMKAVLKPSGILGAGLSRFIKGGALTVPFYIRGKAADPKFIPDMKKGAGGLLESTFGTGSEGGNEKKRNKIGDTLRNLFGK